MKSGLTDKRTRDRESETAGAGLGCQRKRVVWAMAILFLMTGGTLCGDAAASAALAGTDARPSHERASTQNETHATGRFWEDYAWPGDEVLSGYIREALSAHPALLGADAVVTEMKAARKKAEGWTNPRVILALMNAPTNLDLNVDPMTQSQIGLVQTVPWPGKTSLAGRAAEHRVGKASLAVEKARWAVRTMVASAYFRLAGLAREKEALQEALALAEETVRAAGIMLSSGKESQANFFQAETEEARIARRILFLEGEIDKARADLVYALGRDTPEQLDTPSVNLDVRPLPELSLLITHIEHAPRVSLLKSDSLIALFDLKRSSLDYFPDLTLAARYGLRGRVLQEAPGNGWRELDDRLSLELSFSIPLWAGGNQRAEVTASKARLEKAGAELMDERIEILAELRKVHAEAQSKAEQFKITRDSILTRAENAYQAAIPDYAAGKLSWAGLNRIRITLSMVRVELAVLGSEFMVKRAELEELTGRILPWG